MSNTIIDEYNIFITNLGTGKGILDYVSENSESVGYEALKKFMNLPEDYTTINDYFPNGYLCMKSPDLHNEYLYISIKNRNSYDIRLLNNINNNVLFYFQTLGLEINDNEFFIQVDEDEELNIEPDNYKNNINNKYLVLREIDDIIVPSNNYLKLGIRNNLSSIVKYLFINKDLISYLRKRIPNINLTRNIVNPTYLDDIIITASWDLNITGELRIYDNGDLYKTKNVSNVSNTTFILDKRTLLVTENPHIIRVEFMGNILYYPTSFYPESSINLELNILKGNATISSNKGDISQVYDISETFTLTSDVAGRMTIMNNNDQLIPEDDRVFMVQDIEIGETIITIPPRIPLGIYDLEIEVIADDLLNHNNPSTINIRLIQNLANSIILDNYIPGDKLQVSGPGLELGGDIKINKDNPKIIFNDASGVELLNLNESTLSGPTYGELNITNYSNINIESLNLNSSIYYDSIINVNTSEIPENLVNINIDGSNYGVEGNFYYYILSFTTLSVASLSITLPEIRSFLIVNNRLWDAVHRVTFEIINESDEILYSNDLLESENLVYYTTSPGASEKIFESTILYTPLLPNGNYRLKVYNWFSTHPQSQGSLYSFNEGYLILNGELQIKSNPQFKIKSPLDVGIGIEPRYKLHAGSGKGNETSIVAECEDKCSIAITANHDGVSLNWEGTEAPFRIIQGVNSEGPRGKSGVELMRIDTEGNITSGTEIAESKLHIRDNVKVNTGIILERFNGKKWQITSGISGTTNHFGIENISNGGNNDKSPFIINFNTGNIGIGGILEPTQKLDISGNLLLIKDNDTSLSNQITLKNKDYYGFITQYENDLRIISRGNTEANINTSKDGSGNIVFLTRELEEEIDIEQMRISSNGKLGIGTNEPIEKVHIKSENTSTNIMLEKGDGSKWNIKNGIDGLTSNLGIEDVTNNLINSNAPLIIESGTGNVGLSINPTQKLDVNGNILCRNNITAGSLNVNGSVVINPNNIYENNFSDIPFSGSDIYDIETSGTYGYLLGEVILPYTTWFSLQINYIRALTVKIGTNNVDNKITITLVNKETNNDNYSYEIGFSNSPTIGGQALSNIITFSKTDNLSEGTYNIYIKNTSTSFADNITGRFIRLLQNFNDGTATYSSRAIILMPLYVNSLIYSKKENLIENGNVYASFTGAHLCYTSDNIEIGRIVSSNGSFKNKSINDAVPYVSTSYKYKDKSVYGVCGGFSNDRIIINSLGEGMIAVCSLVINNIIKSPIENGDYICSSGLFGFGIKQDDDLLHNYTVAKATEDCDFNSNYYEKIDPKTNKVYRYCYIACTYHCG